ncbi:MAG: zinc ribbon domain-containing protein [Betaproteobacteria bacterium]|nr:zinc ribbon domain-containing protein [Betaproteobacteria bacterium]
MNQNLSEEKILHSGLLPLIPRALANEKALFALLVTGLLSMALVFLGSKLGSSGFSAVTALFSLLTLLVILPIGTSVAGLLLMDQAHGRTPRPLRKAVFEGIPTFLRILGITLLSIALTVVFYLFLCLLLFICKLPVIGPALYAVLFPVLVILAGLLFFGLMAGLSMVSPAVWNGATIREALTMLQRIVTHRAVELLVNLLLLTVFIVLAEIILAGIFLIGSQFISEASKSILDIKSIPGSFPAFAWSLLGSNYTDYTIAEAFGSMTGMMLFLSALMAMSMMGLNLIYLQITKNLPLPREREHAWESMLQSGNKEDKKEPVIRPIPQATTTSSPVVDTPDILASFLADKVPAATVAENAKTTQICPHCQTPVQLGDRFCGNCGGSIHD